MEAPIFIEARVLLPQAWKHVADRGPIYAFNPTILSAADGFLFAYRMVLADGLRRIAICKLDEELKPIDGTVLPLSDLIVGCGHNVSAWFADPRLFRFRD